LSRAPTKASGIFVDAWDPKRPDHEELLPPKKKPPSSCGTLSTKRLFPISVMSSGSKGDCIRATAMWTIDDARKAVIDYVKHYNEVRLHSAISYVAPHTKLAGKEKEVFADRDAKLEAAREQRRLRRAAARQSVA
jgi:hypothetical protein